MGFYSYKLRFVMRLLVINIEMGGWMPRHAIFIVLSAGVIHH